jgi:hypothetical protein
VPIIDLVSNECPGGISAWRIEAVVFVKAIELRPSRDFPPSSDRPKANVSGSTQQGAGHNGCLSLNAKLDGIENLNFSPRPP